MSKPDRPMFADDLFLNDIQQVFSVRTGNFIGYRDARPWELEEIPEPEEEPEPVDINQLTLQL